MTREHDRQQGHNNNNNNHLDEQVEDIWDEYSADSELDNHDARRPAQHNHHGRGSHRRCEVRNNDNAFHKLKFMIPPFDGKYDPDAYISWELAIEQKFTCFEFPENARVRAATSEFTDFASVWWVKYGKKHPDDISQTWVALKWVMRARFVSSYYARDLINKLQKQGAKSVEEYYQELQIGMLRCNLEEREDTAMARLVAGLNHEIQDILEYKDFANITRLFHFACKAEREVQGRHASAKTNFSAGRINYSSTIMGVQPHRLFHQVRWHLLHPAIASSLKLLPQIQQLGRRQQQRVPHHPPSLLHLQAE
jgi:hypothetical protein